MINYIFLRKVVKFGGWFYFSLFLINLISFVAFDEISSANVSNFFSILNRVNAFSSMFFYLYWISYVFIADADIDNIVISKEPVKNGIHSIFQPFSYDKEWKTHVHFLFNHNVKNLFTLFFRVFFYVCFFFFGRILTSLAAMKIVNVALFLFFTFVVGMMAVYTVFSSSIILLNVIKFLVILCLWLCIIVLFGYFKIFSFLQKKVVNIISREEFYFFLGNPIGTGKAVGGVTAIGVLLASAAGTVYLEQSKAAHDRLENATKLFNTAIEKSNTPTGSPEWAQQQKVISTTIDEFITQQHKSPYEKFFEKVMNNKD